MKHFLYLSYCLQSALPLILSSLFLLIFWLLEDFMYFYTYVYVYICVLVFVCIYSLYTILMDFAVSSPFHPFFPQIHSFSWGKSSNQPWYITPELETRKKTDRFHCTPGAPLFSSFSCASASTTTHGMAHERWIQSSLASCCCWEREGQADLQPRGLEWSLGMA